MALGSFAGFRLYQASISAAAPAIEVEPDSVTTTNAFGTPVATLQVNGTGLASAVAFGTSVTKLELTATGFADADAFGTSVTKLQASNTGISDADAFGTFTAKKYLWIEFSGVGSNSSSYPRLRFNNDTGNNFAYRQSADGGGDNTQTSQNHTNTTGNVGAFNHYFNSFVVNKSDKEKLVITQGVDSNTAGAGNAPRRREVVGKWANTSDSITSVQVVDLGSHNFSSARLKVWGSD